MVTVILAGCRNRLAKPAKYGIFSADCGANTAEIWVYVTATF
jgi:hypothetical protein